MWISVWTILQSLKQELGAFEHNSSCSKSLVIHLFHHRPHKRLFTGCQFPPASCPRYLQCLLWVSLLFYTFIFESVLMKNAGLLLKRWLIMCLYWVHSSVILSRYKICFIWMGILSYNIETCYKFMDVIISHWKCLENILKCRKNRHLYAVLKWNRGNWRNPESTWRRTIEKEKAEVGKTWNKLRWLTQDRYE